MSKMKRRAWIRRGVQLEGGCGSRLLSTLPRTFYVSQKKRRKFSARRKKNALDNTGSELVSEYLARVLTRHIHMVTSNLVGFNRS